MCSEKALNCTREQPLDMDKVLTTPQDIEKGLYNIADNMLLSAAMKRNNPFEGERKKFFKCQRHPDPKGSKERKCTRLLMKGWELDGDIQCPSCHWWRLPYRTEYGTLDS